MYFWKLRMFCVPVKVAAKALTKAVHRCRSSQPRLAMQEISPGQPTSHKHCSISYIISFDPTVFKDVRAQNFPRTDFFKTLTAGRK